MGTKLKFTYIGSGLGKYGEFPLLSIECCKNASRIANHFITVFFE